MAKTKHNNFLDTVDEIFTDAKNQGIIHLYTEDDAYTGRHLQINGRQLYHFGTTSYMGLDQDERLKQASIDAILKYGTQFPLSKTYVSFVLYRELEELLHQMYQNPVLVAKNSTLCHLGAIPSVVRDEDAVILDHQVHHSVQSACQMLKPRGIRVELIRHSNLDMLEERIKALRDKHEKIWYMVDGVYSMFGDCAPLPELLQLLDKYPQLHLYVDDVHGQSWAGKHGTGYVLDTIGTLHEKMILVGTLSKSFGASGAVMACANEELLRYVKTFGGPLTFSAQLEPASVGAAVASARIHLSDEIYAMQAELREKVRYCNTLIKEAGIPLVDENDCPVFFIPTGLPSSGYNMSKRLMNEGFYVNMGIFPAVPVKNTGIRFTLSRHNGKEDIRHLVDAIKYHYPLMLEEEHRSENDVRKAFKLPLINEDEKAFKTGQFTVVHETSIDRIDRDTWNGFFGDRGIFDWNGVRFLEDAFTGNASPEHNWDFHYVLINDNAGETVAATFFTVGLYKDDMMAPASVSMQIEAERERDPYYLTSKVVSLGSLASEGDHLYVNRNHARWRDALKQLFNIMTDVQEESGASMLMLRDFADADDDLKEFLTGQGFIKVTMPEACTVENPNWKNTDEFLEALGARSRRHIRNDVLKHEASFDIEIKDAVSDDELAYYQQLFMNVKSRNFDINTFDYPERFFSLMQYDPDWEFIVLRIKDAPAEDFRDIAAVIFCYRNAGNNYNPLFVGINYEYQADYHPYRQAIFQVVKRARDLKAKRVFLGLSATIEKKKFGAVVTPKVAYVQAKDNFNMEFIESISVKTTQQTR